jgi:Ca2+-binding RTX toxin-like protein
MIGDYLDPLSSGDDRMYGAGGVDHMFAGGGIDFLWGDEGDDWMVGGYGQDELHGGGGRDILFGGQRMEAMWPFLAAFGAGVGPGGVWKNEFARPIERFDAEHALINSARMRWGVLGLVDERAWARYGGIEDVAINYVYGDDGDDWMIGGDNVDELHGGRGADFLVASGRTGDRLFPGGDEDADVLAVRRRRLDYAPYGDSYMQLSEDAVIFLDDIPSER